MCIGNRDGGDDAVGPYIADKLKDDDIEVLDCGVVPENYTSLVKKHKEKIGVMHISTHGIPISVLINYLAQYVENIIFIGIQPKIMSGKLTDEVRKSADNLLDLIKCRNLNQIEILK